MPVGAQVIDLRAVPRHHWATGTDEVAMGSMDT